MKIKEKLFNEFISKLPVHSFIDQDLIDDKHKKIVKEANRKIKNDKEDFLFNFRNWKEQSDFSAPAQISFKHLKILGIKSFFKLLIKKILFFKYKAFNGAFKDDLNILKLYSNNQIIKKNPVHKTPDCNSFYIFDNDCSSNSRWNRYLYLASQIVEKKLLIDGGFHLDIGSYYGGLQSILKKEFKNSNFIMVDFPHQLLRSYIFLKQIYPKSNHIIDFNLDKITKNLLEDSFIYIPVNSFHKIKDIEIDLLTNFFSFGEMKKKDFVEYFNSQVANSSKNIYLANRVVSSPYFEKTYDSDLNILDYIKEETHKVKFFDILPIGHYYVPDRLLFDTYRERPISSPYFECIQEKK